MRLVYIEWLLELVWIFWRRRSCLASVKIWTADLPAYVPVIVLTVLPHNGWKITQKSLLTKWDGGFGLGVFDLWQEFLEGFSEHCNFPWSFV